MNESHLHATPYETGKHSKKGFLLLAFLYIEVFDVSRSNPKVVFYLGNTRQDFFIMGGVGDVSEHVLIYQFEGRVVKYKI